MKITRISLYQMDVPIEPFKISGGRVMEVFDETIVRIETDAGIEGWGDSVPWGSNFVAAWARGARAGIEELAPKLIGLNPCMIGQINEVMDFEMKGQPFVKSAIDVACWDILGQATGQPIYMLLGGMLTPDVHIYGSIPPDLGPALDAKIADLRTKGFKRFSSKSSGDVATDVAYLRHLGAMFEPGESLKYDANAGWQVQEALRIINQMGQIDVSFEQPCASYEDCRTVRRTTGKPLILDESATDLNVVLRAHADGVLDGLNLKLSKVGGLSKMRTIRDVCATLNVPMEIQDSSWSELACSAIAHMAHSTPSRVMLSSFPPIGMKLNKVDNPVIAGDRFMKAPDLPGLGTRPRIEMLGAPIGVFET